MIRFWISLTSNCEVIFHLAAIVGVKLIVNKPIDTIETNIIGTNTVLKAALRSQVKVVMASTSEVYGKSASMPFREENDLVLGSTIHSRWIYAVSKLADEFLGMSYYREKGLPVVICRLFNIIGPRQTGAYGMVVPRFVQQALQSQPLTVYGDGQQMRCFLNVEDAIQALVALSRSPEAIGEVFNIGGKDEICIEQLARKVLALSTPYRKLSQDPGDANSITFVPYEDAYGIGFEDVRRRIPDTSKLTKLTGWIPQHNLEETLVSVIRDCYFGSKLSDS